MVSVFDCTLHELTKFHYPEGNLTYVYQNIHVPFPINRVFYSYDIPGGENRGAHAHKECHQFIIAASGSFEVVLDDGFNKRTVLVDPMAPIPTYTSGSDTDYSVADVVYGIGPDDKAGSAVKPNEKKFDA